MVILILRQTIKTLNQRLPILIGHAYRQLEHPYAVIQLEVVSVALFSIFPWYCIFSLIYLLLVVILYYIK